ncbi:CHASE domain-containing protein [Zhongshania sp.]|uniref:CHASE domain-containing protein n=1 Tax=Zhongshania sp. TaxID=1971902 RepID=UPI0035650AA5
MTGRTSLGSRLLMPLRAWFFIGAFVVSGLLLSVWLYVFLDERQQNALHHDFHNLSERRMQVLANHVYRSLEVLYDLAAFLQISHNRDWTHFRSYVSGSLSRLPELQALEWIPLVDSQQRLAFEAQARQQGIAGYQIIEFDGQDQLRRAGERPRYFPVLYALPETINREAIGLDLASHTERRAALEQSLSSGSLVATAPLRLAQEKVEAVYGILIFAPVYAQDNPARIEGFALAVYRSVDLLNEVFAELRAEGVHIEVRDRDKPELALYAPLAANAPSALSELRVQREFRLGHRVWQVSFQPEKAYFSQQDQYWVFIYPLITALLVLSFAVYAAIKNRYLVEVEREVDKRTRDLSREIVQRREAEAAAHKAEQQYRSIFENAIDGIFQSTADGRYLRANTALAKIYGYPSRAAFMAEVSNIGDQIYVKPQRRRQFMAAIQRDGHVSDFVSEVYRRDGSRIHILEKAISVYDETGRFRYYEGNVQDVSDRIHAEKALQQANELLEERVFQRTAELAKTNTELQDEVKTRKAAEQLAEAANAAKTQFLASISHEIRTPLNAIIGYSQILQQQAGFSDKQQRTVATIAQSGNHLLGLIDDILDLAKIESGHTEPQRGDFDLSALIYHVAYILHKKCEEKGLLLKVEGLGKVPVLLNGDEGKLRQILLNLLNNAIKYTAQGEVILRVIPEDTYRYRFEVIDSGPGIPAAELETIFEQFYQRSAWQEGSGLGLAIASRLATALGATLQVKSTPGLGSNFFFYLNFAPSDHHQIVSGGELTSLRLQPGQQCRALVVDDIEHNRDILQQLLEAIGCSVFCAGSGQTALEYLAAQSPDVVFMDIFMPGMNGVKTRHAMLEQQPNLAARFVAFSASVYEQQRKTYLDAGFDAVISKPFRIEQLHGCLRDILALKFEEIGLLSETSGALVALQGNIPSEIAETMMVAARYYNVTKLRAGIDQLALLKPAQPNLVASLRTLAQQHRLGEFMAVVTRLSAEGEQV